MDTPQSSVGGAAAAASGAGAGAGAGADAGAMPGTGVAAAHTHTASPHATPTQHGAPTVCHACSCRTRAGASQPQHGQAGVQGAGPRGWLFVEPFHGGSHKRLMDTLVAHVRQRLRPGECCQLATLSDKKWHWRMRASSAHFADQAWGPCSACGGPLFHTVFCSSMLNLAELLALRPDLARVSNKVLYFHENQLAYPKRKEDGDWDFSFGWAQMLSSLVADVVAFNSQWNRDSFLDNLAPFINRIPDRGQRVTGVADRIRPKALVAYFPVDVAVATPPHVLAQTSGECPDVRAKPTTGGTTQVLAKPTHAPLHIAWNHRWEHDKDPGAFFAALRHLHDSGIAFHVTVLGEQFAAAPPVFAEARRWLHEAGAVRHWGYAPSKAKYYELLAACDVVVSTALHEFYGVSVVEACMLGLMPLCPARLSYPELLPSKFLYTTQKQLHKRLRYLARYPSKVRAWRRVQGTAKASAPLRPAPGTMNNAASVSLWLTSPSTTGPGATCPASPHTPTHPASVSRGAAQHADPTGPREPAASRSGERCSDASEPPRDPTAGLAARMRGSLGWKALQPLFDSLLCTGNA